MTVTFWDILVIMVASVVSMTLALIIVLSLGERRKSKVEVKASRVKKVDMQISIDEDDLVESINADDPAWQAWVGRHNSKLQSAIKSYMQTGVVPVPEKSFWETQFSENGGTTL